MRLRIRILLLILKSLFYTNRKAPLESVLHFFVLPSDCVVKFMGNDRYHAFMDCGRIDLLIRLVGWKIILRKNLQPFVYTSHIMFRKPLRIFTHFIVRARIVYRDSSYLWVEHTFEQNGHIMAMAISKNGICIGRTMLAARKFEAMCQTDLNVSSWDISKRTIINNAETFLRRMHW